MSAAVAPRRVALPVAVPILVAALCGSVVAAVMIGPVPVPAGSVLRSIGGHLGLGAGVEAASFDGIVWHLRLPRVLMSVLCGMGLAGVGVVMQGVTRNPLADPYLLGLSSGAILGAVTVIAAGLGSVGSPALSVGAFVGSALAFGCVMALASGGGTLPPMRTVLAGVAVGEMCAAVASFLIISATDAEATRSLVVWLLGGFAGTTWRDVGIVAAVLAVFVVGSRWDARVLDALALGDDTAESLGIRVHRARRRLLLIAAALTAVLVAANGAVAFVGLVVPHAVRPFTGARHARVLLVAMLVGGVFLVWVDTVARTVFEPQEVPVGVITALVGAPFFAYEIRRQGRWRR